MKNKDKFYPSNTRMLAFVLVTVITTALVCVFVVIPLFLLAGK